MKVEIDLQKLTSPKVTELVSLISGSLDGYSMEDTMYALCIFQAFLIDYSNNSSTTRKTMQTVIDFILAKAQAVNSKELIRQMQARQNEADK